MLQGLLERTSTIGVQIYISALHLFSKEVLHSGAILSSHHSFIRRVLNQTCIKSTSGELWQGNPGCLLGQCKSFVLAQDGTDVS